MTCQPQRPPALPSPQGTCTFLSPRQGTVEGREPQFPPWCWLGVCPTMPSRSAGLPWEHTAVSGPSSMVPRAAEAPGRTSLHLWVGEAPTGVETLFWGQQPYPALPQLGLALELAPSKQEAGRVISPS